MLLLYYQFNFHWAVFEGHFRIFFCGKAHISSKHIICFEKVLFTELIVILIWFFLEENAILTAFSSCYPHFHNLFLVIYSIIPTFYYFIFSIFKSAYLLINICNFVFLFKKSFVLMVLILTFPNLWLLFLPPFIVFWTVVSRAYKMLCFFVKGDANFEISATTINGK